MKHFFRVPCVRSAAAAAVTAGVSLAALLPAPARAEWEPAMSADEFVDRIGVCTHWSYADTPYGTAAEPLQRLLGGLGVRHIRDAWSEREALLFASYGIRTTLIVGPGVDPRTIPYFVRQHLPQIAMVEGPNEVDRLRQSAVYQGQDFPDGPRLFMQALYTAMKSGGAATAAVPVIAPSTIAAEFSRRLAPLRDCDRLVMHSYAGGQMPSRSLEGDGNNPVLGAYSLLGPGAQLRPIVATETGYHTALGPRATLGGAQPGVSEKAQAKYLLRLFALYANAGIQRTFIYELADEFPDYGRDPRQADCAAACFGLLKHDLSPKPAYNALSHLTAILGERRWNAAAKRWEMPQRVPENPPTRALDFTLTGNTKDVRHTLLRKASGKWYLLLWREVQAFDTARRVDIVNPPAAVTLTLGAPVSGGRVFLPGASGEPRQIFGATRRLPLSVPDEVLVVELWPGGSAGRSGIPAAPARLAAATTATGAAITWGAPKCIPPPAGYFVYRMGAYIGRTTKPAFTDTGLLPGMGYSYEVRVFDAAGRVSAPAGVLARTRSAAAGTSGPVRSVAMGSLLEEAPAAAP